MEHIDPRFLHQSFDPENAYSIPYFWGTLGIVYNKKVYPEGMISEWQRFMECGFKRFHSIY